MGDLVERVGNKNLARSEGFQVSNLVVNYSVLFLFGWSRYSITKPNVIDWR